MPDLLSLDTKQQLKDFLSQIGSQEQSNMPASEALSILGLAPDLSLKPKQIQTLEQRVYGITTDPTLSEKQKQVFVAKMFENEERIEAGRNNLLAVLAGIGGFAGSRKLMGALKFLQHEPYSGKASPADAKALAIRKNLPQQKHETAGSKILKDFLSYLGSAYLALTAARLVSQKSGLRDLRTPISQSKINTWNLMNR